MNIIEKQIHLGRELMELNASWFRKIAEFDTDNVKKFVEFNQDFAGRLPEVKDVQSFVELQREYGERLWEGTQEAVKGRGELLKEAVEENGSTLRKVFSQEEAEEEVQQAA